MSPYRTICFDFQLKNRFIPVFSRVASLLLSDLLSQIHNLQLLPPVFSRYDCHIRARDHWTHIGVEHSAPGGLSPLSDMQLQSSPRIEMVQQHTRLLSPSSWADYTSLSDSHFKIVFRRGSFPFFTCWRPSPPFLPFASRLRSNACLSQSGLRCLRVCKRFQ